MLIIDVSNAAKASLRSMVGLTDDGCAYRTAGAPGELKAEAVWRYSVEVSASSFAARTTKDCL